MTHDAHAQLFETADTQAGLFTSKQALEAGFSRRMQSHYVQQGRWVRRGWGVYRLRDYPSSQWEQLVALSLWSRGNDDQAIAVVSHDTALRLYELSDHMPERLHLTVPPSFRKAAPPKVVLHRAHLERGETQDFVGFQATGVSRTLCDVAQDGLSPELLQAATWEALERGLVRRVALEESILRVPPLREVFAFLRIAA